MQALYEHFDWDGHGSVFDVKQYQGETLKEYISRFGAQVVKVGTTDEPMIVYAFKKGVCPGSFSKSLNRSRPKTFAEVKRRAVELYRLGSRK